MQGFVSKLTFLDPQSPLILGVSDGIPAKGVKFLFLSIGSPDEIPLDFVEVFSDMESWSVYLLANAKFDCLLCIMPKNNKKTTKNIPICVSFRFFFHSPGRTSVNFMRFQVQISVNLFSYVLASVDRVI